MSEPAEKRGGQNVPESHSPRAKPAILRMAKKIHDKVTGRYPEMAVEPGIVSKRFALVGVEGKIDIGSDFGPALGALYRKVREQLSGMRGLAQPARMVGYWYYAPGSFDDVRYFAGVEADAVFAEERRGMAGGSEGAGYKWLGASRAYTYNEAIPGDLEVYRNPTDTAPDCEAEIYIPIKENKEGSR